MSSFVLNEVDGEDVQLDVLMNSNNTGIASTDLNRPTETAQTNIASTNTHNNDIIVDKEAEADADAALDSFLETSVAEVNLALSHNDAVTAAVNAAALDATTNAVVASVVVDEDAVTAAAAVNAVDVQVTAATTMKGTEDIQITLPTSEEQAHANDIPNTSVTEKTYETNNINTGNDTQLTTEQTTIDESYIPSRVGRWTLDEKILFLYGLQKFGKGHWKKISMYVPDRSLVQIKSHAQKVLKRIQSGENVFRRLEENISRLQMLVKGVHEKLNLDAPTILIHPSYDLQNTPLNAEIILAGNDVRIVVTDNEKKKKADDDDTEDLNQQQGSNKRPRNKKSSKDGTEQLAASALCQLAGPDEEGDGDDEEGENPTKNENNNVVEKNDNDEHSTIKTEDNIDVGESIEV